MLGNTTGSQNTATGVNSLQTNQTGEYNVANGYQALVFNTTGSRNAALGGNALLSNTDGADNVADRRHRRSSTTRWRTAASPSARGRCIRNRGARNIAIGDHAGLAAHQRHGQHRRSATRA